MFYKERKKKNKTIIYMLMKCNYSLYVLYSKGKPLLVLFALFGSFCVRLVLVFSVNVLYMWFYV